MVVVVVAVVVAVAIAVSVQFQDMDDYFEVIDVAAVHFLMCFITEHKPRDLRVCEGPQRSITRSGLHP